MGGRAFLQNKFSEKSFSAVGSTLLQTSNFLFYRLLKKYNQILRTGPWFATHDLGGITFRQKRKRPLFSQNALNIFPIHVYKLSFLNTSNIYRVNSN